MPRLRRDRRGTRPRRSASTQGRDKLRWWMDEGQQEQKAKDGGKALVACAADLAAFVASTGPEARSRRRARPAPSRRRAGVLIGCDFGSTTAKAVVLSPERELLFSCYALSKGNPIEDAQSLFRQVRDGGLHRGRRRSRSPATARTC